MFHALAFLPLIITGARPPSHGSPAPSDWRGCARAEQTGDRPPDRTCTMFCTDRNVSAPHDIPKATQTMIAARHLPRLKPWLLEPPDGHDIITQEARAVFRTFPSYQPFQRPKSAPNYVTRPTYPPRAPAIQPLPQIAHNDTREPSKAVRAALSHDWTSHPALGRQQSRQGAPAQKAQLSRPSPRRNRRCACR